MSGSHAILTSKDPAEESEGVGAVLHRSDHIEPAPTRARLWAVPRASGRLARMPFIGVLIALFGVGMAGLLMLNTSLQNQAFDARSLNRQATELAYVQADLESQIDLRAAPQELARSASALGMRPNPRPAFLEVPSGKVIGDPVRVSGREVPGLVIKTPAERAAARAARAARKAAKAQKAAAKRAAEARRTAAQSAAAQSAAAAAQAARQQAARQQAAAQQAAQQQAAQQRAGQAKNEKRRGR